MLPVMLGRPASAVLPAAWVVLAQSTKYKNRPPESGLNRKD
nr:MAG TPA: hypothetical protein [Bacteriophage sp.]